MKQSGFYFFALFFFLTLTVATIAFLPFPANAQEDYRPYSTTAPPPVDGQQVSREYAEKYYDECLEKIPRRFTPKAHKEYCTCTAAAMQALMTTSDVYYLKHEAQSAKGKKALIKMTEQVYIPCMEYPVQDIVYLECLTNRTKDRRVKNIPDFCTCVGTKAKDYMFNEGAMEALNIYVYYDGDFDNPVDALLHSPGFINKRIAAGRECLKEMYAEEKEEIIWQRERNKR